MIENSIYDFNKIYEHYEEINRNILNKAFIEEDEDKKTLILQFYDDFIKFDAKLRLGIAIKEIKLTEKFVDEKHGDLKECHLLLYKLSDIWFAYEAFFIFHQKALTLNLLDRKILWLDDSTNIEYSNTEEINNSLQQVNFELKNKFNNIDKRTLLKGYLQYCEKLAKGGQKARLKKIVDKIIINQRIPDLSHTEVLTIIYSIRNNFVHNGEITVYPEHFTYALKKELLLILYKYLVIITIKSATITIQKKLIQN
ncbi:hypothetical protein [Chryseobacterium sediminis]|uniref:Apea-like HEPN domain-containing protein n=1 Tax=Chryseobacterium sediminis TaxID=1679494 RepID=A0A5B2TMH5_9FLAO|nr:hypothetical protein [Chryseobacterium sediminis]KAA2215672.1 hypothetical protein FW780_21380 [Chryseobacterium sediminis]